MCPHRGQSPDEGEKKSDTTTFVSVGSRTTVQESTQEGLTSGFGMGPGITPPLWPCTLSNLIDKFALDRGPHRCVDGNKKMHIGC